MTDDDIFVLAVNSATSVLASQLHTSYTLKRDKEFEKLIVEMHMQILQAAQTISGVDFCATDTDVDLGPQS